jgi:predicted DNA-binding transcriptional regulator AlpA
MSALQAEKGCALPRSLPPVGLSRVQAAAFIGVSPAFFDALVLDGRMPRPKRINTRVIWDRRKLEEAFDCLPTDEEEVASKSNSWDDVLPKFKH